MVELGDFGETVEGVDGVGIVTAGENPMVVNGWEVWMELEF